MLAAFDFAPNPTRADLDRWRAELDEDVHEAIPAAVPRVSIDKAVSTFHEMRAKGRTVASIARTLGLSPEALASHVAEHTGDRRR